MDASGNTGQPTPVPQALYLNNSALTGTALSGAVPTIQLQNSYIATPLTSHVHQRTATALTVASNSRSIVNTSVVPSLSTLPTASAQPGPPPALVPVSGSSQRQLRAGPPPPYANNPLPTTRRPSASAVAEEAALMKKSLEIECHQIRVGVRKYMPACHVVFKDDGVLFTLREYTNAPLLLNARAIQRCKANLNCVHPVMFFALEASCIKQIRQIFHMEEDEFSDKASTERKRCITVFPKTLTQSDSIAISHSFNSMKAKFGRPDNILFPIDMDTAIDILYGVGDRPSNSSSNSSSSSSSNTSTNNTTRPVANGVNNSGRHHPYARVPPLPQQPQQSQAQQMVPQRVPPPVQSNVRMTGMLPVSSATGTMLMMQQYSNITQGGNRMASIPAASIPRYPQQQQPLIIPQDPNAWEALKKSLTPNRLYPVIQQNDPQRRVGLFIWNGKEFISYQTDSDIYLHCHNTRIGSLRRQSAEPVTIKSSQGKLGIQFKIKMPDAVVNIALYEDEVSTAFMCFERICAMFLVPHQSAVIRIRNQCKMKGNKDPSYDPQSKEERQKHLILFLRQISPSQKNDLMGLKRGNGKPFFSEVDAMGALRTLSAIKKNTPAIQGKKTDYMGVNGMGSNSINELECLAQELTQPEAAPPVDDDDDDVIMTAEEVNTKCPYTQQEMKDPVRNKNCGHSYEKEAIIEFIARRRAKGSDKNAKCPYAGCGNTIPLIVEDLDDNRDLKAYIRRKQSGAT